MDEAQWMVTNETGWMVMDEAEWTVTDEVGWMVMDEGEWILTEEGEPILTEEGEWILTDEGEWILTYEGCKCCRHLLAHICICVAFLLRNAVGIYIGICTCRVHIQPLHNAGAMYTVGPHVDSNHLIHTLHTHCSPDKDLVEFCVCVLRD
jgi:hypothetical protein